MFNFNQSAWTGDHAGNENRGYVTILNPLLFQELVVQFQ